MLRKSQVHLTNWLQNESRKPLVIRGARQVGKSTLVRQAMAAAGRPLLEINCEQHPELEAVFRTLDINRIIDELESLPRAVPLIADTVLFLDEIQTTPSALASLRYFYEQRPELPVIAAGSLLEFTLSDHTFSMPVGRIEFLQMVPMDFEEFLQACGELKLVQALKSFSVNAPMSDGQHLRLLDLHQQYLFVGGMPEAVREFSKEKKLSAARPVHENLLAAYKSDFSKYGLKHDLTPLARLLDHAGQQVGKRIKYSRLLADEQSRTIRRLLDLLIQARLLSTVQHSDATDIPLGAEARPEVFKLLLLDVGLLNALLGLPWNVIKQATMSIRDGSIAEQFVGQELIANLGSGMQRLHYWLRDGKAANAEVDYLVVIDGFIVPIEVKAGKSGTLRSLRTFCSARRPQLAVRFDTNPPSLSSFHSSEIEKVILSADGECRLLSLPIYSAGQIQRLVRGLGEMH